jgi:hypothetical protein
MTTSVKHYDAVLSLRKRKGGGGGGVQSKKPSILIGEGNYPDLKIDAASVSNKQVGIKSRHYVWATMFVIGSTLFYMYPIMVPMLNAKFPANYESISPRVFVSSRYGYEWWITFIMSLNILLPYALALALVNNNVPEWAHLHYYTARLLTFVNIVLFIMFSVDWVFLCNNGFVPWSTLCNDPRYCCVYFGSSQINLEWCPNITPCTPDVSGSMLYRSDEFFQIWLWCLFFWLLAFSHRAINKELAQYGFFRESIVKVVVEEGEENTEG